MNNLLKKALRKRPWRDIIAVYENADAYEDSFAIPLNIPPQQWDEELINKLIEILK